MQIKLLRLYFNLAGSILLVTAMAKIASSIGSARVFDTSDPITLLEFKHLFWLAGGIELVVAAYCFFAKECISKAIAVCCLATVFLMYRIGLYLVDYRISCHCLGDFTQTIHVKPQLADDIVKCMLAYLLFGSGIILLLLWWQKRKTVSASALSGTSASSSAP